MSKIIRAIGAGSLATMFLMATGCSTGEKPTAADSTQARATLQAALDAWKAGGAPESLANQSPPILVKDVDWKGGYSLLDYKAEAEGKLVGYDMNYPVVLELKSPKGVSVKKNAVYTVTTSPGLLVSRQEG